MVEHQPSTELSQQRFFSFVLFYFQALADISSTQLTCPCSPENSSKKEWIAELRDGSPPTLLRHPRHPDTAPCSGHDHVLSSQSGCSFLPPSLCTSSSASQNAFLQQALWETTSLPSRCSPSQPSLMVLGPEGTSSLPLSI